MKTKLFFLLLIASVALASSCNKIKEATNQDVNITPNSIEFNVAAITNTSAVTEIGTADVNFDLNALIKAKASAFGVNNVKSVKLKSLTAEFVNNTADADNNFGNLESISAEISATGKASQVMASFTNSSAARVDAITMPANGNVELKDLVTGTGIKYTLKGKLRKAIKASRIKVTASYDLVVGL